MQNEAQRTVDQIKESINATRRKESDLKAKELSDVIVRSKFAKALRLMKRNPFGYRLSYMINEYDKLVKPGIVRVDDPMTVAIWAGAEYSDVFDIKKIQKAVDGVRDYDPWIVSKLAIFRRKKPFLATVSLVAVGILLAFATISMFESAAVSFIVAWVVLMVYMWKMMQIAEI